MQQTDTDTSENHRGKLVAGLERKLEELRRELRQRDDRIAELRFQVGKLETLLHGLFDRRAAGTKP